MKVGLSTASFYPNYKLEDSMEIIKKLGFDVAEVFLNSPSEYEEDFIKKLVEIKQNLNLQINSVHGFSSSFEPFLFDRYKRRRDDMFVYFKKICKAAKLLGANCYTFHGMRLLDRKNLNEDLVIDIYNKLTYTALEMGIKIAQENVSWCMSSDLNYLYFLKEKCKYDLFYTFDIKQAYKAYVKPNEYLKIMGKDLINLHLNDRDKDHVCLLPGNGEVKYNEIFNNLKDIDYSGNGIIEVYSENYKDIKELKMAKEYIEKCAKYS